MNKIKQWILNRDFVRQAIIAAHDRGNAFGIELERTENLGVIKRFENLKMKEVDEMVNKKLNDLLSIVDERRVVKYDKTTGTVYIGDERATPERLANLKAETDFFLQSDLWKILHETPKKLAQEALFIRAESLEDLGKGKSMLYTLSTQENIINTFTNYKPKVVVERHGVI